MDGDIYVTNSLMKADRVTEIDIVKALGIICMVLGHAGAPFTKFIYLFHMAIFFIASGFFYKESTSDSVKSVFHFTFKKIKQLWVPYFVWNMVYVILNNFFIRVNVYTDNIDLHKYVSGGYIKTHDYMSFVDVIRETFQGAIFAGGTEMGGAFWFLRILFMVSVCYCVSDFIIKKVFGRSLKVQLLASILLLIFGYWCSLKGYLCFGLAQTASFYCLYFIGYNLRIIKSKYQDWGLKHYLLVFLFSFAVLLILNQFGGIGLSSNSYVNPCFLLATSFMGWCFLYSIAHFIALFPVKKFFLGIGKRTLSIVILHFLAFKLVAIIVAKFYGLPDFCIASFPNLYGEKGVWWLAYTIVGVGIPVALSICYRFLISKTMLVNKKKNA